MKPYIINHSKRVELFDDLTNKPIFFGDDLSISYTLSSDDIKCSRLNTTTPYESRRGTLYYKEDKENGYVLHNPNLLTTLDVTLEDNVIYLDLETELAELSEFGLNLPFNFMGKKNGGMFDEQYLFNSAYRSIDNKYKYCFINSIKGKSIIVAFLSDADGWKMDYSPWVGGHYFTNLKCLANFDQVYNTGSNHTKLSLALIFVDRLEDGFDKLSSLLNVPIVSYDKSYTFNGSGEVHIHGNCDKIEYVKDNEVVYSDIVTSNKYHYSNVSQKVYLVPSYKGIRGLDASVFGYSSLDEMCEASNDFVANSVYNNNYNLCEGQFWASAMLKSILKYGSKKEYDDCLKRFFNILLPDKEDDCIERLSIMKEPLHGLPPYSVYKSRRIQEHFAGVSILLDAYKVYKDNKYLDYAINVLNSLLDNYQRPNGSIATSYCADDEDYTTVTCLIFPIIDMALFFKDKNKELYEKYLDSASRVASFIYNRGLSFPTEGGDSLLAEEQMEDGSISCSALTLLYYCAKIERKEEYITKAKEILDLHDAWIMQVPDANVYYSSLRWWETRWEANGDGPALCCGHGWTIWRAEADYWYYYLTKDESHLYKMLNSFTSNFAKFTKDGDSISCYQIDYIVGGGFTKPKTEIEYKLASFNPGVSDYEVSRYAWARAFDSILQLSKEELEK